VAAQVVKSKGMAANIATFGRCLREGGREEGERQAGRKFREPTRYVTCTAETERAHAPPLLVTLGLGSTQTRLRV